MVKTLWSSSDLNIKTKVDMLVCCMFSCLLYAAETWTMRAEDSRKFLAFEMRCYRRILKVCWKDRVTNKSVKRQSRKTTQQKIKSRSRRS